MTSDCKLKLALTRSRSGGWWIVVRLNSWSHLLCSAITTVCLLGLTAGSGAATGRSDVELKIGIVQRFGEGPTDQLNLQATPGDRLRLNFKTGDAKREWQQALPASGAKLEVVMQPLPTPSVKEQVVLSTHRSFETAEDTAKQWRQRE